VDAKTAKTRKRGKHENGESPKTAKTRKPRKRGKRENDESPKTRKRRKRRKPENCQKCFCFLAFSVSRFLVFSLSGFLVPLAAPFWPGRVFYVLRSFRLMKSSDQLSKGKHPLHVANLLPMGKVGIPADGAKHTNIFLPRLGLCEEIN